MGLRGWLKRLERGASEHLECFGLFKRREIFALQVFDQGDLHDLRVVRLADHARQLLQPDLHGRLVPAFSGDDLEPLATLAEHEWLDDALLGNRRHQFRQVAHDLAGLVRVRIDEVDRHHPADRRSRRRRQRLYVVLIVTHPHGLGQASPRHDQ